MKQAFFFALIVFGTVPLMVAAAGDLRAVQNGESVFALRPDDPAAIHVSAPEFPVTGDGVADDTAALQKAIDRVERYGIVLVPDGTYRLTGTLRLWRGVRLIGYGKRRPTFLVETNTPGFQGAGAKYVVQFCSARPKTGEPPGDACNTTFFSGINNINFEIRSGNPSAVACRYFVAQLCSIENADFRLGDARAGIEMAGNEIEGCRFFGGRSAIVTHGTSAGWQVLVADCGFEGQKESAFRTTCSGLTVVRCSFRNMPRVFSPFDDGGVAWAELRERKFGVPPEVSTERLFFKDCIMDGIRDCAVRMSDLGMPENQLNVRNAACRGTPVFLSVGADARRVDSSNLVYRVNDLSAGLHVDLREGTSGVSRILSAMEPLGELPAMPVRDYDEMPAQATWVNVRTLGALGDGKTDDAPVIRKAIESHKTLYFPVGRYLLKDTLSLRPDTCLVGLHPHLTRFLLPGAQGGSVEGSGLPEFGDRENPKAMVRTPRGGKNLISGIGFSPGRNKGAVSVQWLAGDGSMLDDAWFDDSIGATNRGNDAFSSLWVTENGGGTFKNIWTSNYAEPVGVRIAGTSGPGRMYLVSVEHHAEVEVYLQGVTNWQFYALQTEEDRGAPRTTGIVMENCVDLTFANLVIYRVMSLAVPHPHGARARGCADVAFRGMRSFSWGKHPFDSSLFDEDSNLSVPQGNLARVTVTGRK